MASKELLGPVKLVNLKKFRENAGLTTADIARAMDVEWAAANRWETGDALPRAAKLPPLADLLGCTIDALYGREPPQAAG